MSTSIGSVREQRRANGRNKRNLNLLHMHAKRLAGGTEREKWEKAEASATTDGNSYEITLRTTAKATYKVTFYESGRVLIHPNGRRTTESFEWQPNAVLRSDQQKFIDEILFPLIKKPS